MTDLGAPLFIDVEGLRIRYVRSPGDATKTPVLMVSPLPESLYVYDDVWADISQVAPLVALDLPGFGQSESRPELMNSEYAQIVLDWINDGYQTVWALDTHPRRQRM